MNAIRQALRDAGLDELRPIPSKTFPCLEQRGEQQVGPDHQRCTKCHTVKPFAAFHRHPQTFTGRCPRCKACRSVDMKQWKRDNNERSTG